jgi:hypothetical protein
MEIRQSTLSKTLGLLIALPVLVVGLAAGTAYAGDAQGEMRQTEGTRVTTDPAPVSIMDAGNNNATVIGVPFCGNINVNADCWTWENNTHISCPSGHFCLYTNQVPGPNGKIFALYHCREYSLSNWLDRGWVYNNNTGGAPGFLRDRNHANLPGGTIAAQSGANVDFFPIWYVKAC